MRAPVLYIDCAVDSALPFVLFFQTVFRGFGQHACCNADFFEFLVHDAVQGVSFSAPRESLHRQFEKGTELLG